MLTLLIICIVLFLLWPTIKKWLARYMVHKTEDFIRSATGMPPRDKKRRERASSGSTSYGREGRQSGSRRGRRSSKEPIIPREYAEDVEFVESVEYSETTIREDYSDGSGRVYTESQVSDVEYVEIKTGTPPPPPRR